MTGATPPGWYPDPGGSGQQRYWDGVAWRPLPPPPQKSNTLKIVLSVIAGVVGIFLLLGIIGALVGPDEKTSASRTSETRPAVPATAPRVAIPSTLTTNPPTTTQFALPSTPSRPAPVAIGQRAQDGQLTFTVTSLDRSQFAGDPDNQYMRVTAQGTFLNVHMTVTNTGTRPQTFFASNQKMRLGSNTYEANGPAAMWGGAMSVPINPGNSITATVSFDVPSNSRLDGVVQLHESLISQGVEVGLA